jgi:invasion protein IalB
MRIGSMKKIGTHLATWIAGAALITLLEAAAAAQQPAPQPAPRPAPAKQAPQTTQAQPAPAAQPAQRTPGQPAPTVQGAQSSEPQRTTATYEDWIVQCQTQTGPPLRKVCEMTQITQVEAQGKSQPFSRVIIPRPAKDQPSTLVVQVPVNVTFSTNVRVQSSDGDQGLAAPFARCVPDGCFADFEIKDEALKKFRSASATGKLSFADAGGRALSVPLSFKGFGNAYDALMKE